MADKITLFLWEADLLYALLREQLAEYCKKKGKPMPKGDTQISGVSIPKKKAKNESEKELQKRKSVPSITKMMSEHHSVSDYIKIYNANKKDKDGEEGSKHISGKRIYQLPEELNESNEPFKEIKLKDIYCHVFFLFLGYKDLEEFRAKAYITNEFICYYYSLEKNTICKFRLSMFFTREDVKLKLGDKTRIILSELDEIDAGNKLYGTIDVYSDSWNVQLISNNTSNNLSNNLCVSLSMQSTHSPHSGGQVPDADFFYGFMTGTNTKRKLFGTEIVAAKDPDDDSILQIQRYLNLGRNYASLPMIEDEVRSVDKLEINNISIEDVEPYANKNYRLLTSTPAGAVLQSRFYIAIDYSSTICVPGVQKGRPLQCTLSLGNTNKERLLVFAYRKKHILYSINSIKFSHAGPEGIMKGAFCMADGTVTKSPIGNKFVMQVDEGDYGPELFEPKKVTELMSDKTLGPLLIELFKQPATEEQEERSNHP